MKAGSPDILGRHVHRRRRQLRRSARAPPRAWTCACTTPPASAKPRASRCRAEPARCTTASSSASWRASARLYGIRVHGVYDPREGYRFNANKLLIDPWARDIVGDVKWHPSHPGLRPHGPGGHAAQPDRQRRRHAALPRHRRRLRLGRRPTARGALARHADLRAARQGLHAAASGRAAANGAANTSRSRCRPCIDHLKSLGVTAVELMPVHAFTDEGFLHERGLTNYWGYNTLAWFAPTQSLRGQGSGGRAQAGGEGAAQGGHRGDPRRGLQPHRRGQPAGAHATPTGIDNRAYYFHRANDRRFYDDVTGVGNTVACDHPIVQADILASLRYFAEEFRIDGFRFDLATVLGRDRSGFNSNSPFFAAMLRRSGAGLREAHRRALGRGPGRLPARQFSARLERVERPLSRHHARLLARRPAHAGRIRRTLRRFLGPVPPQWPQAHRQHQLRRRARWLHAARHGVVQRASTTRPISRTTATATPTTTAGTAASKAPPTTCTSSRCAAARCATC